MTTPPRPIVGTLAALFVCAAAAHANPDLERAAENAESAQSVMDGNRPAAAPPYVEESEALEAAPAQEPPRAELVKVAPRPSATVEKSYAERKAEERKWAGIGVGGFAVGALVAVAGSIIGSPWLILGGILGAMVMGAVGFVGHLATADHKKGLRF